MNRAPLFLKPVCIILISLSIGLLFNERPLSSSVKSHFADTNSQSQTTRSSIELHEGEVLLDTENGYGQKVVGENIPYRGQGTEELFPVAVVDSGIDHNHDLILPFIHKNSKLTPIKIGNNTIENDLFGIDLISNDNNPFDDYSFFVADQNNREKKNFLQLILDVGIAIIMNILTPQTPGHGTHVSGIILNQCDDLCSIVPIKVSGLGLDTVREIKEAVNYIRLRGYKVANISMGIPTTLVYEKDEQGILKPEAKTAQEELKKLKDAFSEASDTLFIIAAGNESFHFSKDSLYNELLRLNLPNLIGVGAVNNQGELTSFSNFDNITNLINLYAPGFEIESTWYRNSTQVASGTSMAAPLVTGLIANLWSKNPELKPLEVKSEFLQKIRVGNLKFNRKTTKKLSALEDEAELPIIKSSEIQSLRNSF